jgi:hypothetical protein
MPIRNLLITTTDQDLVQVPDPYKAIGTWDPLDPLDPPARRYAVTNILVCNNEVPNIVHEEAGTTNFDMHIVKRNEAKGDINKVVNSLQMPSGETFTFDSEKIVLESGDRIVIVGDSPTNLSATVSWLEV